MPCTQYHFPQSKVTKQYLQKVSGKLGTYQYVLVHTWYILACTSWRTCTFTREWCSFLMLGNHNILVPHTHYHFPQAKVTSMSVHTVSGKLCTGQYIPVCTSDAHVHTHTDHSHSQFISNQALSPLWRSQVSFLTLVWYFAGIFLLIERLLDC